MKINPIAAIRSTYRAYRDEHKQRQQDKHDAAFVSNSAVAENIAKASEDAILALHRLVKGSSGTLRKKYDTHGEAYFTTKKYSRHENTERSSDKDFCDLEDAYKIKRTGAQQEADAREHLGVQLNNLINVSGGAVKEKAEVFVNRLTNPCSAPASSKEMKAMIAALARAIKERQAAA